MTKGKEYINDSYDAMKQMNFSKLKDVNITS